MCGIWSDQLKSMSFTEPVEPMTGTKRVSADGVDLVFAWSSAVEHAGSVSGNLAFDIELDRRFLLIVGVELCLLVSAMKACASWGYLHL